MVLIYGVSMVLVYGVYGAYLWGPMVSPSKV